MAADIELPATAGTPDGGDDLDDHDDGGGDDHDGGGLGGDHDHGDHDGDIGELNGYSIKSDRTQSTYFFVTIKK